MPLPDLFAFAHCHVLLSNSSRAEQHGRFVFCIQQNHQPRYWLKLQSQDHPAILQSFERECALYAAVKPEHASSVFVPHQMLATTDVLKWLQPYLDKSSCSALAEVKHWHAHTLMIAHAHPIWSQQVYSTQEWLNAAFESIQALSRFHQNAIHGDLKAAHFVRFQDRVCLIDFERSRGLAQCTEADSLHATPHYMAPELFHGQRISLQSDYYALGVILLETYLNRRLNAKTYMDWALLHCQSDLLGMLKDEAILSFLHGLLAKYASQRYQNHAELLSAYQKMSKKLK